MLILADPETSTYHLEVDKQFVNVSCNNAENKPNTLTQLSLLILGAKR